MESDNEVLFVLANHDFKDEEYLEPKSVINDAGITCKVVALVPGECTGTAGTSATTDFEIGEVNPDDFSTIVFVGGTGVEGYLKDEQIHSIAKIFYKLEKLVCAICWAPSILANAGILNGKKATAWSGAKGDLEAGGAAYTGEAVTADGNVITANGPDAATAFGEEIAKRLI